MEKEPEKKLITVPKLTIGLGVAGTGLWGMLDIETLRSFISAAWREELIKMLIAFFVAGIMHRFLFRRDIEKQLMKIVTPIVDALNNIADKSAQIDGKISDISTTIIDHGNRIQAVEQHLTPRTSAQ